MARNKSKHASGLSSMMGTETNYLVAQEVGSFSTGPPRGKVFFYHVFWIGHRFLPITQVHLQLHSSCAYKGWTVFSQAQEVWPDMSSNMPQPNKGTSNPWLSCNVYFLHAPYLLPYRQSTIKEKKFPKTALFCFLRAERQWAENILKIPRRFKNETFPI